MEGILTMSYKEGDRLKIIAKIESRSMTTDDSSNYDLSALDIKNYSHSVLIGIRF